jgi:hypothetical protein
MKNIQLFASGYGRSGSPLFFSTRAALAQAFLIPLYSPVPSVAYLHYPLPVPVTRETKWNQSADVQSQRDDFTRQPPPPGFLVTFCYHFEREPGLNLSSGYHSEDVFLFNWHF